MIRNTSKTILLEARSDTTVNLPRKNYTKKPKGPLRGAFTHQLPDQVPSEEGNANQSTMELYLGIGHNRTTRKKGNPTSTKKGGAVVCAVRTSRGHAPSFQARSWLNWC